MSQLSPPLANRSGIVRQSCDACSQSHVRCQPHDGQACVRCHGKGLTCNYSISRRGPPKVSQPSYVASHDNIALKLSRPEAIEQYVPGQDGTQGLSQSSGSSQDPVFDSSVSLEQLNAWSLPSFTSGDCGQTNNTDPEPWERPDFQASSNTTSSSELGPSPSAELTNWNFDLTGQKRHPSQALCTLCSDRSDKLSQHASHSFWPLATQSAQNFDSTMSIGIDELLSTNRGTIESITGILDCPCSENMLLFEKCSTNVGRVIDWYAGAFLGHDMVIAATVRIGSYVVSPAESRNQTSAIVLAEMHNLLLPLLDRLGVVYERLKSLHGGRGIIVGDPKCHRAKINSFFSSVRRSAQASL